ncbi:hypothetical protein Ac2012v2_001573 [Leucoagaricus gongylophorus]
MSTPVDPHFCPVPHYMYTFSPPSPTVLAQPKRRQVKNACTHCQKACKKCDDGRPCLRCVKYGVSEGCVDSKRKQRKKGIKRGPYKKRDGRAHALDPHGPMHANPAILTTPFILSDCYDQYTHYTPKPGQGDQAADYHSQSLIYPIFHAPFPPQPSYPKINLYPPLTKL